MKSNIVIFWILTAYFVVISTVYTLWNIALHDRIEWAGSITILLSAGLTGFIASYLALTKKKQGGVLVEDIETADIDDGDPELGEFSPWSWWPLFLGFAIAVVVLGLCIGFNFWLSFLGLPLVIVAVVGWIYEYYRGNFAR
ncbi:cytochrome c oxidase subunit 4 [Leucobacter insecticola]|uniref:Cytochrome c oxidase polypeptide 4 n=1 Tax=Leucobacter insecticola TaxID=2714934 RepID=A0A6G8FJK7_9MICO|nr:cytochrome c oxidase subunit 4 [Leucobacter insecticola]QIM16483.1 cytochrome c oxidase subunit 4 [Leucobacter insecticola]